MQKDKSNRDHLFISYATEDGDFAEWLSLRLTAEGYLVWCDRTHLLGGESYPADIDQAIKERSFRLLALLSHASLNKPNPRKERTLALSIARERNVDFLIPLNVDSLSATDLDWMTSDLTFIPFSESWAAGFAQLLKKLNSIKTPKSEKAGRAIVCDWMSVQAKPSSRPETLRSNLLPVLELPKVLHKFEIKEKVILPKLGEHWSFFNPNGSNIAWAFDPPADELGVTVTKELSLPWQDIQKFDSINLHDLALAILRKAIPVKCLQRGMKVVPKSSYLYFSDELLDQNRLWFKTPDGKRSFINAIGERTFRKGDERERIRYHLAPCFYLTSTDFPEMVVRLAIRLHLTDLRGNPLEGSKITSRRKRICRNWWNHQWLSRFLAIVEWLCEGQSECEMLRTANGSFRISSTPLNMSVDQGIDEASLRPITTTEADIEEIEEDEFEMRENFNDINPEGYDHDE